MKLLAPLKRMLKMCPEAWYIFIRGVQLCAALLICALALLMEWDSCMTARHDLYHLACALNETAQAVLMLAVLFSVLIEDVST